LIFTFTPTLLYKLGIQTVKNFIGSAMSSEKSLLEWRSSNITVSKCNMTKCFTHLSCFHCEMVLLRDMNRIRPSAGVYTKYFKILSKIIFIYFLESIKTKHCFLSTILVSINSILLIDWCRAYFYERMIYRDAVTFSIWIFFIVFNQMILSVSFKFRPSTIYDIWKIIDCVIFGSCPCIISLSVRMISNLCIMNWVVSKSESSHNFGLFRWFLIQSFNDVWSHWHLSCENGSFSTSRLRNSFLYIINFNSSCSISHFYYKCFSLQSC